MIRTEQLSRVYGSGELQVTALRPTDLNISSGEFVSIIGPSGAGKSTLLYQISMLDEPTSGKIWLDNRLTTDWSQNQKTRVRLLEFGYVFQDYALLPELTALENVALPLLMQGFGKKVAYDKATEALAKVHLLDKLKSVPSKMSGGQQQRAAIARAIGHNPKILFADEPTANLDSENSDLVMESFKELHESGQTIIMVTHEMEYARMAKRTIEIRDGRIVGDHAN